MVKYSIITVCKNAENEIGKTIESVLKQDTDFSVIEMIIVDGLSEDNTKEVVEFYTEKACMSGLTISFNSEKDSGIYDAMNKGAILANGEWCLYLNAGDVFYNFDSLKNLIDTEKEQYDIIYGDTIHKYRDKYLLVKAKPERELTYQNGMEFCHQSCMIKRSYLLSNPFSLEYKIAGDYEFFTRAFLQGVKFFYSPKIVSVFDRDGLSSTNGAKVILENSSVQYKYHMISEEEYNLIQTKKKLKIRVREFLPKFIVGFRHKIIMYIVTREWERF